MDGIKIEGFDSLIKLFPEMEAKIKAEAKKAVAAAGLLVQNEIKDSMRKAKHGKTYRKGPIKRKRGGKNTIVGAKFHRASAPGEAPAVDTGRLIGSVNSRQLDGGFSTTVGVHDVTNVKYAKALEYGTSKIAPRPFLIPALQNKKPEIMERFKQAMDEGIKVR